MAAYHVAYSIVNKETRNIISTDKRFQVYHDETEAWVAVLELKKNNPSYDLTVMQNRITLPWK